LLNRGNELALLSKYLEISCQSSFLSIFSSLFGWQKYSAITYESAGIAHFECESEADNSLWKGVVAGKLFEDRGGSSWLPEKR
jgi:hypothetical protein